MATWFSWTFLYFSVNSGKFGGHVEVSIDTNFRHTFTWLPRQFKWFVMEVPGMLGIGYCFPENGKDRTVMKVMDYKLLGPWIIPIELEWNADSDR